MKAAGSGGGEAGNAGSAGRAGMDGVAGRHAGASAMPDKPAEACDETLHNTPRLVLVDSENGLLVSGVPPVMNELSGTIVEIGEGGGPSLQSLEGLPEPRWLRVEDADGQSWTIYGYGLFDDATLVPDASLQVTQRIVGIAPYAVDVRITLQQGDRVLAFYIDSTRGLPTDALPEDLMLGSGTPYCTKPSQLACAYGIGHEMDVQLSGSDRIAMRSGQTVEQGDFSLHNAGLVQYFADAGCCSDCTGYRFRFGLVRRNWEE